jgi:hypothetical protein
MKLKYSLHITHKESNLKLAPHKKTPTNICRSPPQLSRTNKFQSLYEVIHC